MEILELEETSAADPEQFLLRRQKRFLKSSNFWEGNCQRPAHVRRRDCEVHQSSEYPRKSLSSSILFCSVAGDYIESAKKLALTRRYLATGDNFNALANLFRVGHSTVRTIICEVVKFPSTEEDFYKPDIC
ncbi:hypothetical protein ACHWQZ_G002478 [Mnemiopsis leidyi]